MWTASLHGDTSGLSEDDAAAAEDKVRDDLIALFAGLGTAGHSGIGGTFNGSAGGPVNLAAPGETVEGTPDTATAADPVAALGSGEVSASDVADAAGVPEGTPVPLAPGQSLAPEPPAV